MANLHTIPIPPRQVKLPNGADMVTNQLVPNLQCYCQGQSFRTDMVVLDMQPYDAILGCDWLKSHSPLEFNW